LYDISLFIPEGICFAAFVACGYTMQFVVFPLISIFLCACLVFLPFLVVNGNLEINGNTTNKHKLETA
jgi:cellobiose-specific phosphotransferase system component IIC